MSKQIIHLRGKNNKVIKTLVLAMCSENDALYLALTKYARMYKGVKSIICDRIVTLL